MPEEWSSMMFLGGSIAHQHLYLRSRQHGDFSCLFSRQRQGQQVGRFATATSIDSFKTFCMAGPHSKVPWNQHFLWWKVWMSIWNVLDRWILQNLSKNDSFADKIITTSVSLHHGHLEGTDKGWQTWIRARTDWENHYSLPCFPWTDPDGQSLHRENLRISHYISNITWLFKKVSTSRSLLLKKNYRASWSPMRPWSWLRFPPSGGCAMLGADTWQDHTHIQGAYHTHV